MSPRTEPPAAPITYVIEPYGGSIRRHNHALPLLYPDDLGITRGDGIFETFLVRGGRVANMQRHLERFGASASAMELPEPHLEKWREATLAAVEEWGQGEGKCTWTYTRGRASTGIASAWVTVEAIDAATLAERAHGVEVISLERTWQLPEEFPAKTINYAATMAALRYARARGAQDVIYVDAAGQVLEGSRSTVITAKGSKLRTPQAPGVMRGTTQQAIFAAADAAGWRCKAKAMDLDYLLGADSVWLVSSTRGPVRVTALNGTVLPEPDNAAQLREMMNAAVWA
ncbi:aminodeoxychorismate lyase [Corynebacterium lizhenjunii]|uniref:aminodeoxychorismate lyase n=1 Tax=Corynebacterium lizhenjunii TaxID=2709394 RepID=UPI0013EAD0F6|nr:aminodeoxychorismate lyase [Corynebacterium lizhenjunii]